MSYAIEFPATPVQRGDKLEGHVDGVGDLTIPYAK